jgi:beta-alanine--pyruvate transaminase
VDEGRLDAMMWPADTTSFCLEMPRSGDSILFESGSGIRLRDIHGRTYIDALSGVFVSCFGYDCQPIVDAMVDQLHVLPFNPPLHGANETAIRLARELVDLAPDGITAAKLLTSGSEATEAAVRMSRLFHVMRGRPSKQKVISNYRSYHGMTYGALALTGLPTVGMFGPGMPGVVHTWAPETVAAQWGLEPKAAAEQAAALVAATIDTEGPDTVAAVMVEPMSTARGMALPDPLYFTRLREICDARDVVLIFDEVVTGFGRTGLPFAAQTLGVTPDLLCLGKGVSGGYAPLSALLVGSRLAAPFRQEDGTVVFGPTHTFGANPVASAAGLAAVLHLRDGGFLARIRELGDRLQPRLQKMVGDRGTVHGTGLLLGIGFSDTDVGLGEKVERACLRRGVITRGRGMRNNLLLAPAYTTTDAEMDEICHVLEDAMDEVLGPVG